MGRKKKILRGIIIIFLVPVFGSIAIYGHEVCLLYYTDIKVISNSYNDGYKVVLKNGEDYIKIFKEYMKDNKWEFVEKSQEKLIFRKNNIQKEVELDKIKVYYK
ncbi:hypothetical protein [Clostridium sp.]|uniref:hypothetical protein n=1 Tax=Clostridium sp. TaxID=1506 RepID=UPI003F304DA0